MFAGECCGSPENERLRGYLVFVICIQMPLRTHVQTGSLMNRALLNFAFSGLLLGSMAYAQAHPAPSASAMVSTSNEDAIQPEHPARNDSPTDADADIVADPASLLPDLPPVPQAKATLIGGTIAKLDRIRDQITVSLFGGGRMSVLFDPRTLVYLGKEGASTGALREGERIYLDTILDGSIVFARSIRLAATPSLGESQGVVLKYRADGGELVIRDAISPIPVTVRIGASTRVMQGDRVVATSVLTPGSLIAVKFTLAADGRDMAREISILALTGTRYTFVGQVTHIDLRTGLLVLNSATDHKSYEVYLDPSVAPDENLRSGVTVTVVASFEGSRYMARSFTIDSQGR